MNTKITFHNMPHSALLEEHANQKLAKILEFVDDSVRPFNVEVWLKANKQHPHHAVEIHLKTPHFNLHAHNEGTDMYVVLDQTIDKMVGLLVKENGKLRDKHRKSTGSEKQEFLKK